MDTVFSGSFCDGKDGLLKPVRYLEGGDQEVKGNRRALVRDVLSASLQNWI